MEEKRKLEEMSAKTRAMLEAARRPDGTIDASKLPTVKNERSVDEWFAEIKVKE
jgi:hypothetical protein